MMASALRPILLAAALTQSAIGSAYAQAPAAPAAAPTQEELFGGFINSPTYQDYVGQVLNAFEPPPLKTLCAQLVLKDAGEVLVIQQPHFVLAGSGYVIDAGAWVAKVAADKCGQSVTRRVLIKAEQGQNQLHPYPLLPGDFRGDLKLEQDAVKIVLPAIMAAAKCDDRENSYMLDVKSGGPSTPQGWHETWTAQTCGKTVTADVAYTSGDGGSTNVTASNIAVK